MIIRGFARFLQLTNIRVGKKKARKTFLIFLAALYKLVTPWAALRCLLNRFLFGEAFGIS